METSGRDERHTPGAVLKLRAKKKNNWSIMFLHVLHFADDDVTQPMVDPPVGLLGESGVIGTLPEKEEEAATRDVELNCDQGLATC